MNAKIALAVSTVAILAAVLAIPSQAAFAATVNITLVPGASTKTTDAFSPNPATAQVGDTVIWTNKDSALHTVESGSHTTPDGKFGVQADGQTPVLLPPGKTEEFKPTAAGDYPYFCSLHPAMVGDLKVVAAGGSTGGSTGGSMMQGTATAQLDGKSYTVTSSSATSKVTTVTIANKTVAVTFDKAGDVVLTLPKAMIDGIQNTATAGGKSVTITPVNSTATDSVIKFTVPDGATTVNITGATVVPEFGVVAALVLAASLVAVIGIARFKGQAFGFRI